MFIYLFGGFLKECFIFLCLGAFIYLLKATRGSRVCLGIRLWGFRFRFTVERDAVKGVGAGVTAVERAGLGFVGEEQNRRRRARLQQLPPADRVQGLGFRV